MDFIKNQFKREENNINVLEDIMRCWFHHSLGLMRLIILIIIQNVYYGYDKHLFVAAYPLTSILNTRPWFRFLWILKKEIISQLGVDTV